MKHAGPDALKLVEQLLMELRRLDLIEKKPGIFYLGRTAVLHFHEDSAGLFADVKVDRKFERYPVNKPAQQRKLLKLVKRQLA